MLKVGLTGGIGSGKSTVARIFGLLGIPVFDADAASKMLLNENEALKDKIIRSFGEKAYRDGVADRKYLAEAVFGNPEKLALLNSIVHPATIQQGNEWMAKQQAPYIIKEAALIFESGSHQSLDYVIGVQSPAELRISRTMERDGVSSQQVQSRMKAQMDDEEKMSLCDFIIKNDEEHMLIPQVLRLHETLMEHARHK